MVGGSTVDYAGGRVRLTWRVAIFFTALFSLGISCRSDPPARISDAFDLPFAGCQAVVRPAGGPTVCETTDAANVRIYGAAKRQDETGRIVVETSKGRSTLHVRAPRTFEWLDRARTARAHGDLDTAEKTTAEVLAAIERDEKRAVERAFAEGLLARIALARGRADEAFPRFRRAIDLHRQNDRISDAADDSYALAFALHQRSQRYEEARQALDRVADVLPHYAEGRARDPYYRGILAAETGDRRGALLLLREAERRAHEIGMHRLARNAKSALALEMQELGRARESLVVLDALERDLGEAKTDVPTPCERVEIANNRGWGAILAGEDARPALERAIGIEGCTDAYLRGFAFANLARVELAAGRLERAEQRLAAARSSVKEPRGTERLAWLELDAKILLARKRPDDALAKLEEMDALARAAVLPLSRFSALAAKADALVALRRDDDAAASLLAAEDVLDDATLLVPLGEGRGGFLADRSRTARAAIDVLRRSGRLAEAAAVARRSIARGLESAPRALRIEALPRPAREKWDAEVRSYRAERAKIDAEAAEDWKLPRAELLHVVEARKAREKDLRAALERALAVLAIDRRREEPKLAEGDLEIVIHPSRTAWIAFAADERVTTAYVVAPPDAPVEEIARTLVRPLLPRISGAKRLRVRAYGAYRKVDVHALVDDVAVEYPIGGGTSARAAGAPAAVVVGNPTGDLPHAEEEAREVARVLAERGAVTTLLREKASAKAIADALRSASALHYAGHGVYGGLEGSESALPLADGARLTVADILSLAPVPRRIVLSGCDAARSDTEAEGLGLAQAFVAAGAEEVVAPTRPVADELAARLAAVLHAGPRDETLATALRRATKQLRSDGPPADWAAFRAVTR